MGYMYAITEDNHGNTAVRALSRLGQSPSQAPPSTGLAAYPDLPLMLPFFGCSSSQARAMDCEPSRLMVDKITTVPKAKIGTRVGRMSDEDMVRLNRAVLVFLGIAAPAGN